ncbi:MAG: DUF4349 domain-containing protein [Ilumatobacteraceae bacterium]
MPRIAHTSAHAARRAVAACLVAVTALAACSGDDDNASYESAAIEEPAAAEPAEYAADTDAAYRVGDGADDASTAIDLGTIGRDVIIEMNVTLASDDIARSVAAIAARASTLGGGVASSQVDYGDPTDDGSDPEGYRGYAVLVVKVPPERIDDLLAGLEQTGTIRSINQSALDVTEQLVDLDVRIENARESVANVRSFMDRAEDLGELVSLEAELTRRQTELERLEAQQRNLSERVALSTVTVEIVPTSSLPEPDDDGDSIADAFARGIDAFVEFVRVVVLVLAVIFPFLVVLAIAVTVAVAVRRRRRVTTSGTAGTSPHE